MDGSYTCKVELCRHEFKETSFTTQSQYQTLNHTNSNLLFHVVSSVKLMTRKEKKRNYLRLIIIYCWLYGGLRIQWERKAQAAIGKGKGKGALDEKTP